MTTTDENRPEDVQRRVQDWVQGAIGAVETADGVGVEVEASRTVSLPDAELDVQPEEWLARDTLRYAEADDAKHAEVHQALASTGGTVTLASGEAAEIAWPDDAGDAEAERPEGAPGDRPVARVVVVGVTIPWPNRTDAQAESA